jgi:hypothetical protein
MSLASRSSLPEYLKYLGYLRQSAFICGSSVSF